MNSTKDKNSSIRKLEENSAYYWVYVLSICSQIDQNIHAMNIF